MGNCTTPCTENKKIKYTTKIDKFDQIPEDTQNFRYLNKIKIPFSATFAHVKIKKCPYKSIGVKISIDNEQYYLLGNKSVTEGQDIKKWKIQKKIDFLKTQYELRKSFLTIDIIDEVQNIVGSLRINLYIISIGPYHQDFMLNFKNGKSGRISFDFKVYQLIQMSLQSLETQINLFKKHPGQNFAFSIQTIVRNYSDISMPSYTVQVVVDQKMSSQKNLQDQQESRLKRKSSKSLNPKQIKQLKQKSNLIWRKTDCEQMPSIRMKILLSQLHHSYFKMLLIKYDESNSENYQQSQNNVKQQLFAECFISFHKLFTTQPQIISDGDIFYQKRKIQIQQKLWIHGRQIGTVRLAFNVQNQKYIKQMQVCVRTQEGIQKTSPVFNNQDQKPGQSCKQIDQLLKLSDQIQANVIQLQQCQNNYIEIRKLKAVIERSLLDMLPLLSKTSKQSIVCYSYSSPKEMIKAQKVLIDIGDKISTYIYEEDETISQLCWLILIALLKRDQFMLSHIGFDDQERKQIQYGKVSKHTKKKIEVGLMYQQFLYNLLGFALKSLNIKGSSSERAFAQIFCAYAYFRIPDFRCQMLSVITKQDDPQVPQWRGIQFSLNQDIDYTILKEDVDSFTALFDWQHSFHKCLNAMKNQNKPDTVQLQQVLSNNNWKNRFHKRGTAFFCFIKYWVAYVQGLVIRSRDIQWKYFPGYNRLLKVFFLELKRRRILEYPDSLKQTANKLIVNQKILSPIVRILFEKANIYDPLTVIKVIQFISQLLTTLKRKNKSIPPLFDYLNFFKAIRMILQSQFLFMVEATLIMLYNQYEMFNYEFRKKIAIFLLKNVFFKIFLHWSFNIRNIFYHILIYRIAHDIDLAQFRDTDAHNLKLRNDYVTSVKSQYENTIVALEDARNQQKQKNKIKLSNNKIKDYHKIMKKKLMEKKLSKTKKQLLEPVNMQDFKNQFPQSDNENNSSIFDKLRRNIFPQKPSYEQRLVQPRLQRTKSETITPKKPQIHKKPYKIQKNQEEVIVLNENISLTVKNKIVDTTMMRIEAETNDISTKMRARQFSPFFNIFEEFTGQITQISEKQFQYLQIALKSFQEVKEQYHKSLVGTKIDAPTIRRQNLYIDLKDYIPEKIDDW